MSLLMLTICLRAVFGQQDSVKTKSLLAAREIMDNAGMCALIALDKGMPQVRAMDPFPPDADFTIWLATNPKSRKVNQIKRNKRVSLYYLDPEQQGYVTIYGTATLVNDQAEKDKHWKTEWKGFYQNRTDQYLLIKVIPDYLEVINYRHGISGDPKTWQPVRVYFK